MAGIAIVRGGGDLASGVVLRLQRAGVRVIVTELAQPLVIRRAVAFAEAIYSGSIRVEEILAQRVNNLFEALAALDQGIVPVMVDPEAYLIQEIHPSVVVDGRMTKLAAQSRPPHTRLVIGLGPGFTAGENCDAVVETHRGHRLGRVIWQGAAMPDTGIPEKLGDRSAERVLRAPVGGLFTGLAEIGDQVTAGHPIAEVDGQVVKAPFDGMLRGIIHNGLFVQAGVKIADLDPRSDPSYCWLVSDKSLAVGGGVLEAVLSRPDVRNVLWDLA